MIANILLTILLSSQILLPINSWQVLGVQTQTEDYPERIINNNLDINISAESAVAVDVASGKILYQKNQNQQQPIASITKLMTALVFLDTNPDFEKVIRYSHLDNSSGENVEFKSGEEIKIKYLFYASLIGSKNNTIKTLVRSSGLSEKKFVELMNQKSVELNLTNTNFKDPTGLSEFNVSTAKDVANLLKTVSENKIITDILKTSEYTFKTNLAEYKIESTNLLLDNNFFNIQYGKTGYIEEAGWCFTSFGNVKNNTVKSNDHGAGNIITVILGSADQYSRFQDTKNLYWWTGQNFKF